MGCRALTIPASYLICALAATAVPPLTFVLSDRGSAVAIIHLGAIFWIIVVIVYSLLPALLVIVFAEVARVRSPSFYGLTGAFAAGFTTTVEFGVSLSVAVSGAIGGLVGGPVYWSIAGCYAGRWRASGQL